MICSTPGRVSLLRCFYCCYSCYMVIIIVIGNGQSMSALLCCCTIVVYSIDVVYTFQFNGSKLHDPESRLLMMFAHYVHSLFRAFRFLWSAGNGQQYHVELCLLGRTGTNRGAEDRRTKRQRVDELKSSISSSSSAMLQCPFI